jgi:endonuclease-3
LTATVIQQALGGHAIPIDAPARRALERLGVAEPETSNDALRSWLEHAIPKNRGVEFVELIEQLAHDTCIEGIPDCPRCELRKICPTSRAALSAISGARKASPKVDKDGAKRDSAAPKKTAKGAAPVVKRLVKKKPSGGK